MAEFGTLCLFLARASSAWAVVASYNGWRAGLGELVLTAERAVYATWGLVVLAVLSLEYCIFTDRFDLEYVASYSNRALPKIYKITALWGGQAGSLLFWEFILITYASLIVLTNRRHLVPHHAPLDDPVLVLSRDRNPPGRMVGLRRTGLGRLLGLGSGRKRLADTLADLHGLPALGDDRGTQEDAARVEPVARHHEFPAGDSRNLHHAERRHLLGPLVHEIQRRSRVRRLPRIQPPGVRRLAPAPAARSQERAPSRLLRVARKHLPVQQPAAGRGRLRRALGHAVPDPVRGGARREDHRGPAVLQRGDDPHRVRVGDARRDLPGDRMAPRQPPQASGEDPDPVLGAAGRGRGAPALRGARRLRHRVVFARHLRHRHDGDGVLLGRPGAAEGDRARLRRVAARPGRPQQAPLRGVRRPPRLHLHPDRSDRLVGLQAVGHRLSQTGRQLRGRPGRNGLPGYGQRRQPQP